MTSAQLRVLILVFGLLLLFGAVVAIMLQVLPGPLTQTDYLVAGAVATLTTMLALFVVLITTWVRSPDVFFKKQK